MTSAGKGIVPGVHLRGGCIVPGVHLRGGGEACIVPGVHLRWRGRPLPPPLEHTGFTKKINSCYKKTYLFIVCPPSMNFCMQPSCISWTVTLYMILLYLLYFMNSYSIYMILLYLLYFMNSYSIHDIVHSLYWASCIYSINHICTSNGCMWYCYMHGASAMHLSSSPVYFTSLLYTDWAMCNFCIYMYNTFIHMYLFLFKCVELSQGKLWKLLVEDVLQHFLYTLE